MTEVKVRASKTLSARLQELLLPAMGSEENFRGRPDVSQNETSREDATSCWPTRPKSSRFKVQRSRFKKEEQKAVYIIGAKCGAVLEIPRTPVRAGLDLSVPSKQQRKTKHPR